MGGCHIVYQMQLCNCVMVAEDVESRVGGVRTKGKDLVLNRKKSLGSLRSMQVFICYYGIHRGKYKSDCHRNSFLQGFCYSLGF